MKLRSLEDDVTNRQPEYHIIESKLLGERFILALDKGALKKLRAMFPDLAIYFRPELEELIKFIEDKEFEHVNVVHKLKKKFRGWIVPSTT
jgi:hypothetical protein